MFYVNVWKKNGRFHCCCNIFGMPEEEDTSSLQEVVEKIEDMEVEEDTQHSEVYKFTNKI